MFKCFRDCLLSPHKIGLRASMKTSKVVLYMFLLFTLYTAFNSVYFISNFGANTTVKDAIYEEFKQADVIDYQIVDGKLQGINQTKSLYMKKLSTILGTDLTVVFSNSELLEMNLYARHIYVVFKYEHVEVLMPLVDQYVGIQEGGRVEMSKYNNSQLLYKITEYTYEELQLQNVNFNKNSKNYLFTINNVYGQFIDKLKAPITIGMVPAIFISIVLLTLFTCVVMSLLLKFFNPTLGVSFGEVFKICVLASTISIIINIFSIIFNATGLMYLAEIIHVIYVILAVKISFMYKNITKTEGTGEDNEL